MEVDNERSALKNSGMFPREKRISRCQRLVNFCDPGVNLMEPDREPERVCNFHILKLGCCDSASASD